jgi:hypothetical protein
MPRTSPFRVVLGPGDAGDAWQILNNSAAVGSAPIPRQRSCVKNIVWFDEESIGDGVEPAAALNNTGVAIVVYRARGSTVLCARLGYLEATGHSVPWGPEKPYGKGRWPAVGLNDQGVVVAAHEGQDKAPERLFCRTGSIVNGDIVWGPEEHYDMGARPSVSVTAGGWVAEAHEYHPVPGFSRLYCRCGRYVPAKNEVVWSDKAPYNTGWAPSICVTQEGFVAEVHQTGNSGGNLKYRTGSVDARKSEINWGKSSRKFASGYGPRVAVNNERWLMEIHEKVTWRGYSYVTKTADVEASGVLDWRETDTFETAEFSHPTVCLNNSFRVMAVGQSRDRPISCRLGLTFQAERWMEIAAPWIEGKTLRAVKLPGAHDAGTSGIKSTSPLSPDAPAGLRYLPGVLIARLARAQGLSIARQLRAGVRYFDLRVAPLNGELRICHAMFSGTVRKVIDQVSSFTQKHPQEIVILDFQHFYKVPEADHDWLAEYMRVTLGGRCVPPSVDARIGDLWKSGQQVIIIYTSGGGGERVYQNNPWIWPRPTTLLSPWANTERIGELKSFLDKATRAAPSDKLFVMQGVLTPWFVSYLTSWSLKSLGKAYNATIVGWAVKEWAERELNIIMLDWVQYGNAVWAALKLNLR